MSVFDLQETSPNVWKAKYRGNYGTYTIKIKTDGKKSVDFSCSCPSDYYPCKHIPMAEDAIRERIAKSKKNGDEKDITLEQLLMDVSHKEVMGFIVRHAQHNPQFKNAVLLEFAHKIKTKNTGKANIYSQLIQDSLGGLLFDYDEFECGYGDDCIEIDVLDQWLDKAQKFADNKNPAEALLICKACIEEFASWLEEQEDAIVDYMDVDYQERPFEIIDKIYLMEGIDRKGLLDYCKSEMSKPKYKGTDLYDGFNALILDLSVLTGSDDFIAMQDKLLQGIGDNSSYEAKKILQRKIDFYNGNKQPDKADEVIKENLQIESFREVLTKKMIAENKLKEAKKLINDFISVKGNSNRNTHVWLNLKLQIAQDEKDIHEIRRISYLFIDNHFHDDYYLIYKSTFTKEEWVSKMEALIQHYEKNNTYQWFRSSVADVLQAEKQAERLLQYIEKNLTINNLEIYHTGFSSTFPAKTLDLFRQAIDQYAQNTGREIYEQIVKLFKVMTKIKGGDGIVKDMIRQYKIIYKKRSAMMEILNRYH